MALTAHRRWLFAFRGVFACIGLIVAGAVAAAPPLTLPAGATPGGAQPVLTQPSVPKPAEPGIFPIPPVAERPLGLTEGKRIRVRAFVLKGVQDRPEAGIRRADIEAILEQSLKTHSRNVTPEQLDQMSRRVAEIQALIAQQKQPDAQGFSAADQQKLSSALRELEQSAATTRQFDEQGFTLGELQATANRITHYYREHGFILAQAYVPAQTVADGKVVIRVLEGKLGRVLPEDNRMYSDEMLQRPFASLIGKPVDQAGINRSLLYLNDDPGLTAFGVFQPGETVGTTDLVLKAQREQRFSVGVGFDNYGTDYTGKYRGQVNVAVNNPTGAADQLALSALQTFDPTDGLFGSVLYERPLFTPSLTLGLGASRNSFSVGQDLATFDIEGVTDMGHLYLRKYFQRGRNANLYATLDLSRKRATITQSGQDVARDDLSVLSASVGFDLVDTRLHGINQGNLSISQGIPGFLGAMPAGGSEDSSRVGSDGTRAGGEFTRFNLNFSRLQSMTRNQSLLLRVRGQYSDDLLTSIEQMALGGPDSVRAYPVAEYLRDSGAFASLDWLINAPGFASHPAFNNLTWGEILQFAVFVDYGIGTLNEPLNNEQKTVHLAGAGLGLRFNLPGSLSLRFDAAKSIGGDEPSDGNGPQYYFTTHYDF